MIELTLIGIGTGNPLIISACRRWRNRRRRTDLDPPKGAEKEDLAGLRRSICLRHAGPATRIAEFALPTRDAADPDYRHGVRHGTTPSPGNGRRRSARICRALPARWRCWSGATLALRQHAAHRRPAGDGADHPRHSRHHRHSGAVRRPCHSLNAVGAPVQITTGRRLRDHGWPAGGTASWSCWTANVRSSPLIRRA